MSGRTVGEGGQGFHYTNASTPPNRITCFVGGAARTGIVMGGTFLIYSLINIFENAHKPT